jgi:hypothetical protein
MSEKLGSSKTVCTYKSTWHYSQVSPKYWYLCTNPRGISVQKKNTDRAIYECFMCNIFISLLLVLTPVRACARACVFVCVCVYMHACKWVWSDLPLVMDIHTSVTVVSSMKMWYNQRKAWYEDSCRVSFIFHASDQICFQNIEGLGFCYAHFLLEILAVLKVKNWRFGK